MKKALFLVIVFYYTLSLTAQDSLFLFKTDGNVVPFALSEVDSISFFRVRYGKVNSVTMDRTAIGLLQGDNITLTISIDAESNNIPPTTWISTNEEVASVDKNGNVLAKKFGSTTITATVGNVSTSCNVIVVANSESVYRHGYSELSTEDKRIYNYILKCLLAFESNADFYSDIYNRVYLDFASQGITMNFNKLMKIANIISRDVPEVYFLANYIPRQAGNYYYLRTKKELTPERVASEMAQVYTACNAISQLITNSSTQFERAKILHDEFIAWGDYGGIANANAGDITGSFITKRAVCEGFSYAYLMLCQQVGLKCVYIEGALKTSSNPVTWGNHAWNLTEIDGVWYMVDITGDGAFPNTCGWGKFLLGSSSITESHRYTNTSDTDSNCNETAYTAIPSLSESDYEWQRP